MTTPVSAGVGRALLDRVRQWAVSNSYRAITLTTFDGLDVAARVCMRLDG